MKYMFMAIFVLGFLTIQSVQSCTIFTIKTDTGVYFGNNEDYIYDNTFLAIKPGNESTYGIMTLGYHNNNGFVGDDLPQGGFNTEGLVFDANALPAMPVNNHKSDRQPLPNGNILENILKYCKNVSEVVTWFLTYDFNMTEMAGQLHYADATGNATVISVNNGEWTFTFINHQGYLISTNYNVANVSLGEYPCWRYNNAALLLQKLNRTNTTEGSLEKILNATRQGGEAHTVYSYLVDVKALNLTLYYEGNFNNNRTFNLLTELVQGAHNYDIGELFNQTMSSGDSQVTGSSPVMLVLGIASLTIISKKVKRIHK